MSAVVIDIVDMQSPTFYTLLMSDECCQPEVNPSAEEAAVVGCCVVR